METTRQRDFSLKITGLSYFLLILCTWILDTELIGSFVIHFNLNLFHKINYNSNFFIMFVDIPTHYVSDSSDRWSYLYSRIERVIAKNAYWNFHLYGIRHAICFVLSSRKIKGIHICTVLLPNICLWIIMYFSKHYINIKNDGCMHICFNKHVCNKREWI